jgi:hypothetical protein
MGLIGPKLELGPYGRDHREIFFHVGRARVARVTGDLATGEQVPSFAAEPRSWWFGPRHHGPF